MPVSIVAITGDTLQMRGLDNLEEVSQGVPNVVITGGGTGLTYTPNANYCNSPPGTSLDTFTYTLTPGGATATVAMTVTCVDETPVAVPKYRDVWLPV